MFVLVQDLRSSIRTLRRRPVYPIVAVAILAVGLSASMAVFTYINGFYQPFPGVEANRLVRLFGMESEDPYQAVSYLDFLDYAATEGAFEGLAASQPYYAASVRLETMTEVAFLEAVSGDYFSVLRAETLVGRGLLAIDDRPGADPVAVISHAWWQRSFNGDPAVIGSTVFLNFRPFTVVGVAAPDFLGTTSDFRPDVWIPIAPFKDRYTSWAALSEDRDVPLVRVYGRLRPGATESRGLTELEAVARGLDEVYPRTSQPRRLRIDAATWIDPRTRLAEKPTVRLMIVTAGVLLLLVCANVANLLVSVALGRQREITLRAVLGASPGRLLRQVLTENVLLSALAGAVALALAAPASMRLGSYFARPSVWGENVPREVAIDLRVVGFALLISVATGVLAGLLPALRAARRNLLDTLKGDSDAVGGLRRIWGQRAPGVHDVLVAVQVALSIVLLVVAGLVLRTLISAGDLDPGFSYERLLVTHISTSSTTLEVGDRERFFREVAQGVSEEPWARTATVADYPLLSPHPTAQLRLEGQGSDPVPLVYSKVNPGFFEALGIEVMRGRSFFVADTLGAPDVAMVNERLAQRYFPGERAVGRRLFWPAADGDEDRAFEIVGVVRDTKTRDFLADVEPTVYFSYPQHAYPTGSALLVSTRGDPAIAAPFLYRWLRDFEPHLAIVNVVPYPEVVRGFLYAYRMNAEMFSALALLGLALAAVGIFSVMSLAVSRKTREIGIRMSIGARRIEISRLIIGRAMVPVVLGVVLGLTAAYGATGLVGSLLVGVEPTDPISLAAGTIVLVAAALLAAYLPARRAATTDPVSALRNE